MPLLLILAILLAFPILEIALLVRLAEQFGWWVAVYLLLSALAGWTLIQEERIAVLGRLVQSVRQGGHPAIALFATARRMIAGMLLILPGVLSDVIAIFILFWPTPRFPSAAANDDIIEGEWKREVEIRPGLDDHTR